MMTDTNKKSFNLDELSGLVAENLQRCLVGMLKMQMIASLGRSDVAVSELW
jgi:hypothetical protein